MAAKAVRLPASGRVDLPDDLLAASGFHIGRNAAKWSSKAVHSWSNLSGELS